MNKFCVSAAVLSASALLFSCGGGAVTIPDTPDGTAATVIQEINKGNPRAVWDAMPASYQKDVTDIVHSFGKQMDAEVMSETMGLLDQVVGLLGSKKELVLGMAKEPMGKQYAMIEKNFDNILALAKSVIGSDAMDANKLASLDVGSFLGGEGAEIFGKFKAIAPMMERDNPFPMLAKMSFKAGEAKDGMVPVQMMMDGKEGGRPENFKKVEERWIPAEMAEDWPKMIAEAKKEIGKIKIKPEDKKEILAGIKKAKELLATFESANTPEDFQKALMGAMKPAMELMGPLQKMGVPLPR
jgi:hypothetical protein